MTRHLLIDGDILAYQAAAASEKVIRFGEDLCFPVGHLTDARVLFEDKLSSILKTLKTTNYTLAFTDGENFRKQLLPTYKANRIGKPKPVVLGFLKQEILNDESHSSYIRTGLEADDVLGILSTSKVQIKADQRIIVSVDKDFKSVPGFFYSLKDEELIEVSEAEADRWWMKQTLMGDTADGYTGCPGIGPKTADKILGDAASVTEIWPKVVAAFEKAGFGEEEALTQARVARILRASDFDFKNKKVKLWEPKK
jgi:DNA polymerase-1